MPAVETNAPNVDARYVQNLTIHITYHTGASRIMLAMLMQLIYIRLTNRTDAKSDSSPASVYIRDAFAARHECSSLRIEISQTSSPLLDSGGGEPVGDCKF
jgi:hypothetical protein